MADTLTASMKPVFLATFIKAFAQGNITDQRTAGSTSFASLAKSLANGTGANNARYRYWAQRTLAASGNDDLDLTGLTDDFGATINFGKLKWFLIRLTAPATGVRLVIGNQGANVFTGWFGAAAHTEEVRDQTWHVNQIDGWTVDGTHKMLRINNPTGSSIVYDIVMLGE